MPYQPTWVPQFVQPIYQPPVQLPGANQYQQPVVGIIKVNGSDSALQYQLPPNSISPPLFDNDAKHFYVVSTDGTGMKTVETFDYVPHVSESVPPEASSYVSRHEFDDLVRKIDQLIGDTHGTNGHVQPATEVGDQS